MTVKYDRLKIACTGSKVIDIFVEARNSFGTGADPVDLKRVSRIGEHIADGVGACVVVLNQKYAAGQYSPLPGPAELERQSLAPKLNRSPRRGLFADKLSGGNFRGSLS